MADMKKFLDYGLKGAAVLIVLSLVLTSIGMAIVGQDLNGAAGSPPSAEIAAKLGLVALIGLGSFAVQVFVLATIGYLVVKNKGGDVVEGGLGAMLAYCLGFVVNAAIGLVISLLGIGVVSQQPGAVTTLASIMAVALCLPVYGGIAFVIGAIGAYGASYMLKNSKPKPKK